MKHYFLAVSILTSILIVTPASAQTEPADSAIKGVVYDLGRAEKQLPSLSPSRQANIKRLQRSMQLAEKRLNASQNKSHPSWTEAKQRLDKINGTLASLLSGGKAPSAPAAAPAAPATASPPVTTPAAPAAQPQTAKADPGIARAQREMKLVEAQVRNLSASDSKGAMRQLKELYRIGGKLSKTDRSDPAFTGAAKQYNAIKADIVARMVKIEDGQLKRAASQLDRMQPLDYANADKVANGRQAFSNIMNSLGSLGAAKDPAVMELAGRVNAVSKIFEERIAASQAQQASLGDVPAKLKSLKQRHDTIRVPGRIEHPATPESVQGFVAAAQAVNAHIREDLAYIQSIDGKAALNTDDGNTFRFLRSALQGQKPTELQRIVNTVSQEMDLNADQSMNTAAFFEETDPQDVNHRNNRLTGEGKFDEGLKTLAAARQEIEMAALYDKEMARTDAPDRNAQLQKIDAVTEGFKEKFTIALNAVRMPEARSDDGKLHNVIAEVAAQPNYGYKFERAVINSKLKRLKKKTGDIQGTVTGATITVYEYEWDQFQATTAEKVGDRYFLFANTYKYYYSGDPRTPMETWILSGRFQSSEILEENIDK